MYPIPGVDGELDAGERQLNYVWYRNVAEGPVARRDGHRQARLRRPRSRCTRARSSSGTSTSCSDAAPDQLPPAAAELVTRTEKPYIQPSSTSPCRRWPSAGWPCIGDAAFAARPHAAAGTAKAAADAWALADALADEPDIAKALAAWEPDRLALGDDLLRRVSEMGARSQFTGTWDPTDPALHFGLYGPDH